MGSAVTICPFCSHENIEGVDTCERCGQSLEFLSKRSPASPLEQRIVKDRIRSLRPREPLIVGPDTTVAEVLKQLVDQGVGCVLVVEDGEAVGIFSERDALLRLNTRYEVLGDRPISEYMTRDPETLDIDDRIVFALHKMDLGGYRHIPILEEGRIVGVISVRDILRYVSEQILAAETA